MARRLRFYEPNISVHVIHRGNNRLTMFVDDTDYSVFMLFLKHAADRHVMAIHAYVLMTNHYHLVVTPSSATALPTMMKELNGRYVRYFNRRNDRIGTLLNGRYRSLPITDETYWLTCVRYIEMNPVRAGIVDHPRDYRWSSYHAHAHGDPPGWLASHPILDALGSTALWRQSRYRDLFATPLSPATIAMQKFHAESLP